MRRQRSQPVAARRGIPPSPREAGRTNRGLCSSALEAARRSNVECREPWLESVGYWSQYHASGRTPRDPIQQGNKLPFTGPFGFEAMVPWAFWAIPQEVGPIYTGSVLGDEWGY